jgi:hypothetical protein
MSPRAEREAQSDERMHVAGAADGDQQNVERRWSGVRRHGG